VHLLWKDLQPVRAESGLTMLPTTPLDDCPPLDVLLVPGGYGMRALMTDEPVLQFLRAQAGAKWITSVCTGSLLLGAAGLLSGYQATTHWACVDLLSSFGAQYVKGRVVVDRNRVTAGGVTAGIDFGLRLVAEMEGEKMAKAIQLGLEYNPEPPFDCGHPDVADPDIVELVRARIAESWAKG
jgi:cyclohexyl-isocyanide hydratase